MYRKIFISFLLLALINFLAGCYSADSITVPEYEQVEEEDGKPDEIYVKTKNSEEYHFSESNFYIENDTLYGKVRVNEMPFEGKFAFGEIESIQWEVVGQSYTTLTKVSQYQKIEAESGNPDEIYLTKFDSSRYRFMKNDYHIENDTLYGKGKLLLDDVEKLQVRKIAISNIAWIEVDSINWLTTGLLSLGIAVVLFVGVVAIALAINPPKF
jgi:hypothetical protein